jgi:hypothetical protein
MALLRLLRKHYFPRAFEKKHPPHTAVRHSPTTRGTLEKTGYFGFATSGEKLSGKIYEKKRTKRTIFCLKPKEN